MNTVTRIKNLALALLLLSSSFASAQCNINSSFNMTQGSNGSVNLVSTATGTIAASACYWSMGNGQMIYGNSVNYVYPASGTYMITQWISNGPSCFDSSAVMITVNLGTCVANPNYSVSPTATASVWNVIPYNTAGVAAALWSWGDGSTSNTLYTTHNYATPGNYIICLSLTLTCGHSASNCDSVYVYRNSNTMVQVNVVNPENAVGLQEKSASALQLNVSPNPGNGIFHLDLGTAALSATRLEVRDVTGRQVYCEKLTPGSTPFMAIDLGDQAAGVYFVHVQTPASVVSKKIMLVK